MTSEAMGEAQPSVGTLIINAALEYDTQKIVHIKNKKIGALNRLIQLAVVSYIIGYAIVYEKGYQSTESVVSSATAKLKGVSYTNISNLSDVNPDIVDLTPYDRIWDVTDYVVPPQQSDAFFVMTNMIITPNQQRKQCAEDPNMIDVVCTADSQCSKGTAVSNGHGVRTGKCVTYKYPNGTSPGKTCQIDAWCPVEFDQNPTRTTPVLQDAKNFTVLIKNTATYPNFKFSKRNILESSNKTYLTGCMFNKDTDQFCPIFRLGDVIAETGEDFDNLAYIGGVVAISINWDCNLDYNWDKCRPLYSFRRIDNKDAKIAKGYNFRFSNYYQMNDTDTRTLYKAYGILFTIIVTGTAGKFDVIPLMLNIGSGMALLTVSTVACDIIVCNFMKGHSFYQKKKYQNVRSGEEVDSNYEEESQQLITQTLDS